MFPLLRCNVLMDLGFNVLGKESERVLPPEIAGINRDPAGNARHLYSELILFPSLKP